MMSTLLPPPRGSWLGSRSITCSLTVLPSEVRMMPRSDTAAGVAHSGDYAAVGFLYRDGDLSVRRSVAYGVLQQVQKQPPQVLVVPGYCAARAAHRGLDRRAGRTGQTVH